MQNTTSTQTPSIQLIGLGRIRAIAYGDVVPGAHIVFNYGYVYTVTETQRTGKNSVTLTAVDEKGKSWTFTRRATTLIGTAR